MSTIGLMQALQSHCLCKERESHSVAEWMPPRGDFSVGIEDMLPKNKVWSSKMTDDESGQNNVNNSTLL